MHWGHAVSKDLLRWKEEGIALYPKKYGDWAFSGSAVVDKGNTCGLGHEGEAAAGAGVHEHRPRRVHRVQHRQGPHLDGVRQEPGGEARGPRPEARLVREGQALGDGGVRRGRQEAVDRVPHIAGPEGRGRSPAASRASTSARTCSSCRSDGDHERRSKWVLYAADGKYLLGDFDGKEFKPDFKEKKQLWYGGSTPRRRSTTRRRLSSGTHRGPRSASRSAGRRASRSPGCRSTSR